MTKNIKEYLRILMFGFGPAGEVTGIYRYEGHKCHRQPCREYSWGIAASTPEEFSRRAGESKNSAEQNEAAERNAMPFEFQGFHCLQLIELAFGHQVHPCRALCSSGRPLSYIRGILYLYYTSL